jgi:IS30 family transposase
VAPRRFTQEDLDAIAGVLNHRPRKFHGYHSTAEVYAECLNRADALTI